MPNLPQKRMPYDRVEDGLTRDNLQIADERLFALESIVGPGAPQALSAACPLFQAPSSAFGDIPNLGKGIKTLSGRPIFVGLQWASRQGSYTCKILNSLNAGGLGAYGSLQFLRNNTVIGAPFVKQSLCAGATQIQLQMAPSEFWFHDVVPAGTYTYKVQAKAGDANSVFTLEGIQLIIYEL